MEEEVKQTGLPTAEQLRALVPTEQQIFERNVESTLYRMFEELAKAADSGKTSHNLNLNTQFPLDILKGITEKLEKLNYKVTIEETQVTEQIKTLILTVDWSA
jgi:hypothetical protein